jgi:hypothetical protein
MNRPRRKAAALPSESISALSEPSTGLPVCVDSTTLPPQPFLLRSLVFPLMAARPITVAPVSGGIRWNPVGFSCLWLES